MLLRHTQHVFGALVFCHIDANRHDSQVGRPVVPDLQDATIAPDMFEALDRRKLGKAQDARQLVARDRLAVAWPSADAWLEIQHREALLVRRYQAHVAIEGRDAGIRGVQDHLQEHRLLDQRALRIDRSGSAGVSSPFSR